MITATFKVGKEDVLAMSMNYYASSPTVRKSRIITQASIPFALVLIAALGYFKDAGYRYLVLVTPLLVIAALWAVLYPRLHRHYLLQTSEKLLKESAYEKAFGTYALNLTEKQIASSSPVGEGTYPWSSVSRVLLGPDHLFIFLAGPQGYPIPRGQVPETTIQEMKAFVEQMIQGGEPGATPNGSPAASPGNSETSGGSASVS